ncbi:MAG: flagellar hook-basal body complex protein [Alphaproteobacteria bacterium]|nr:flagellar hook-basal body complex protein [Alphaproteobacteria bacterium]
MSLFAALTVAVNGLNAQSSAIGNISDNLANTQTVGYKRVDTTFQALITNSNAQVNDPGGVRATPKYQNSLQGNLVASQSSTALAITGNGFFAVRQGVVGSDGLTTFSDTNFFTRRGDYSLNKDGYLVNGAGYYLTGYSVDDTGVVNTAAANPIQISALLDNPVATSSANYVANLPAGKDTAYATSPSTIQLFDNLGNPRDMTFTWTKVGDSSTNSWSLQVDVPGGVSASSDFSVTIPFNFDSSGSTAGTLSAYSVSTGAGIVAGSDYTVTNPGTGADAKVSFSLNFAGAGAQTISIDFGDYQTASGLTQFADENLSVTTFEQNGIPRGSFQSLSVDKNGFLVLNYDNGRSKTFYQIPIVQFFATDSLQRVEGGAFAKTIDSGTPRFSAAGKVGAGTIVGNSLEGSNVDIADEFTKMIQSQRVYSANARTITTTNSMLEEVINIVR